MATHLAGVWINRVRLPVLHVVSWTGKMNISLAAFVPENLVSRDRNLQTPAFINVYISWHAANLRFFTSMTCRPRLPSKYQHQTLLVYQVLVIWTVFGTTLAGTYLNFTRCSNRDNTVMKKMNTFHRKNSIDFPGAGFDVRGGGNLRIEPGGRLHPPHEPPPTSTPAPTSIFSDRPQIFRNTAVCATFIMYM